MISTIKGEVTSRHDNYLIIQIGGIGLKVFSTKQVCAEAKTGDFVNLFTSLVVREELLALYGFEISEQCDLFNLLLSVSGIGPKTALSIISTLSVESIVNAIMNKREEIFCQVPGIGEKSAQRMILFMHDKIGHMLVATQLSELKDVNSEVMDALLTLGYSIVEAQAAIQTIPKDIPDEVDARLRIALQYFST